jgi:hypothetical protein
MHLRHAMLASFLSAATLLSAASDGWSIVQTFAGPPAGTVVAGALPGGGTAPGTAFPDFTLKVVNNAGPQSLLIFDSSNPTGDDWDLGTPNQTCGGPGIGFGGQVGRPGENCVPRGNLLIIAEDLGDANGDGIVDDPDDDADGGKIIFEWDAPTAPKRIVILDIDHETASVTVKDDVMSVTVHASDLGNNSAQTIDLSAYPPTTCLEVRFSSSGAVAEIEYDVAVQAQETSWGRVKGIYRAPHP